MWKRSLVRLFVEFLSWSFSLLRKVPSTTTHSAPDLLKTSLPETSLIVDPLDMRWDEIPFTFDHSRVIVPSTLCVDGVGLSVSSILRILEACKKGDHSLSQIFGVTTDDLISALERVLHHPSAGGPSPSEPRLSRGAL